MDGRSNNRLKLTVTSLAHAGSRPQLNRTLDAFFEWLLIVLEFDGSWRFSPPPDGTYRNQSIPDLALGDFDSLISKVAGQGEPWDVLELYKRMFSRAAGLAYFRSSSQSWAQSDLSSAMSQASGNAPLFLEAFYDACESARARGLFAPDAAMINEVCERHDIGYTVAPPALLLRESQVAPVSAPPPAPTLADEANELLQQSMSRSEDLLNQGRYREAVQESLWVLESVATAFRGVDFGGTIVGGRYFNQIVRELRRVAPGTTLDRVAEWCNALQGYLSSPTGGGVRHGLDLNEGLPIGPSEGRLFCNLMRSYIAYLLAEHGRVQAK